MAFEDYAREVVDPRAREAIFQVADTCLLATMWFRERGLDPTPADVVAFARLVFEREATNEDS